MTKQEALQEIEAANKAGRAANLEGANLEGANLEGANLEGANLEGANLYRADLEGAYLRDAYLRGANLYRADLKGANLKDANLKDANLEGANLYSAYLRGANLEDANLYSAYLRGANLYRADLRGAYLRDANLRGANLYRADLEGAKHLSTFSIVPDAGSFVAWKNIGGYLIKLAVPSSAERLNGYGSRKCRVSAAKVLSITEMTSNKKVPSVQGGWDRNFIYKVGELAVPDRFCDDKRLECSNGIHCFITKDEAINY